MAQRSPDFETYGHCNQAGAFHHTEGTVLVSVPHGAHAADAKPGTMLVFFSEAMETSISTQSRVSSYISLLQEAAAGAIQSLIKLLFCVKEGRRTSLEGKGSS